MGNNYTAAIRYYTRSGNTKKLADAIAGELNLNALDVSVPLKEKVDILFLGCSYYAFDIDPAVKAFIEHNADRIGRIVCFGTSAMMKSMKKPVMKVAQAAKVAVASEEFHCPGKFAMVHKDRPNGEDLAQVRKFAHALIHGTQTP